MTLTSTTTAVYRNPHLRYYKIMITSPITAVSNFTSTLSESGVYDVTQYCIQHRSFKSSLSQRSAYVITHCRIPKFTSSLLQSDDYVINHCCIPNFTSSLSHSAVYKIKMCCIPHRNLIYSLSQNDVYVTKSAVHSGLRQQALLCTESELQHSGFYVIKHCSIYHQKLTISLPQSSAYITHQ